MSSYININTFEYPFYAEDIKEEPNNFAEVVQTESPVGIENQIVNETQPILENGNWVQQWVIRDLTSDEILERNANIIVLMARDRIIEKSEALNKLQDLGLAEDLINKHYQRIR